MKTGFTSITATIARNPCSRAKSHINIRIVASTPVAILTPLMKVQYRNPSIQQFFEENIQHGMEEIRCQYGDVLSEGKRLGAQMPHLAGFEKYFT